MLKLSRKVDTSIIINRNVELRLLEINHSRSSVTISIGKILDTKKKEKVLIKEINLMQEFTLIPDCLVKILRIQKNQAFFCFDAPDHIPVHRKEIFERLEKEGKRFIVNDGNFL